MGRTKTRRKRGSRHKKKSTGKRHQRFVGGSKTFAIVQYDDRPLSERDQANIEKNKKYSQQQGYEHIFLQDGHKDLPAYWRKVKSAREALFSEKYKGVLWLDTDAYVYNKDIKLDSVVEDGKDMYISTDISPGNKFNAGVWLVMNTDTGKKIMDTWLSKYNPAAWSKQEDGKWTTEGRWSGKEYEQGSFAEEILPQFTANIKEVPKEYFNSLDEGPDVFIVHQYFGTDKPIDSLKLRG